MPPLSDAYTQLNRADEHLREVQELAHRICTGQADATRVQVAPGKTIMPGEFGHLFSVESGNTPIDGRFKVVVGEAFNCLRSCLDYLVGELAELDSGSRKLQTQFPVEQSPAAFHRRRKTFLNGLSEAHILGIESLQPYSGTQWTMKLARMSNWHKHNKLVLVAHDYLVGGTMVQGEELLSGEVPLQFQFTLTPSLHIQREDGLQLMEALIEIRNGVASALEQFSPEFDGA